MFQLNGVENCVFVSVIAPGEPSFREIATFSHNLFGFFIAAPSWANVGDEYMESAFLPHPSGCFYVMQRKVSAADSLP